MAGCQHKNPLGFAFCVTCGERVAPERCPRCGFACDERFIYCGGCGGELHALAETEAVSVAAEAAQQRYDLAALVTQFKQEDISQGSNGKVNQDDIRALLDGLKK